MKIVAVDTAVLRIPTRKPIALDFPFHSLVVAHVRTDEGVTGLGYTLAFGGGGVESIQAYLVTRLTPLLVGQDPLFVERLWERMFRADRGIKRQGIAAYALSAPATCSDSSCTTWGDTAIWWAAASRPILSVSLNPLARQMSGIR